MSTRSNIVVTDSFGNELWFYKHSDGYPEGNMPILQKFIEQVRKGVFRDNAEQSSGWLIILGAIHYNSIPKFTLESPPDKHSHGYGDLDSISFSGGKYDNWKVGAIEPAVSIHGDIEYLYLIDLVKKTISCYDDFGCNLWDEADKFTLDNLPRPLFVDTAKKPWKPKNV